MASRSRPVDDRYADAYAEPRTSAKTRTAAPKKRTAASSSSKLKSGSSRAGKSARKTKRTIMLPHLTRDKKGHWMLVVPLPLFLVKSLLLLIGHALHWITHPHLPSMPSLNAQTLAMTAFAGVMAYALLPPAVNALRGTPGFIGDVFRGGAIAATFTPTVQRWAGEITRWAGDSGLDPNLLATVMQIESCGHPSVTSSSGAQGLFQVMPFHFASGESMTDPEINAARGVGVLNDCLARANGDVRLALACYNGGPSQINRPASQWPAETQRYVVWGEGVYADAREGRTQGTTVDVWLNAGGSNLCNAASHVSK